MQRCFNKLPSGQICMQQVLSTRPLNPGEPARCYHCTKVLAGTLSSYKGEELEKGTGKAKKQPKPPAGHKGTLPQAKTTAYTGKYLHYQS